MIELETVFLFRGDTDRKGNAVKDAVGTVDVLIAWAQRSASSGRFDRAESAVVAPEMYVPKGSDVRARDRIERSNGERFAVVGRPVWDGPSEVEVFGGAWMVFHLESING